MKRFHIIIFGAVLLTVTALMGCSALLSSVDKIRPVHMHGGDVDEASTPAGFVVTVDEVRSVVPITKYVWNIYADTENYYLSSAIQKLTSKSGDNSWLAGKNGIRIKGTDRSDIETLKKLAAENQSGRILSPIQMRKALNQER